MLGKVVLQRNSIATESKEAFDLSPVVGLIIAAVHASEHSHEHLSAGSGSSGLDDAHAISDGVCAWIGESLITAKC